jgi:tetratricopeptide (TPR) repeat protein
MRRLTTLLLLLPLYAMATGKLNEDGMAVVRLAADEYREIISDTPVVSDKALTQYLSKVASSLIPHGETIPGGLRLDVTLLNKEIPEIYATTNGHILITSGALLALQNEAQLAAVFSHEVAHLLEAHYPAIYQAFKENERKERSKALAADIAGVVVGQAIEFATQYHTEEVFADVDRGNIGYEEASKRILAISTASGALEGFGDVFQSLPPETRAGSGDPRLPLELVADAEGLKLLVRAGYDPSQAGEAWQRLRAAADKQRSRNIESMAMNFLPPQMRSLMRGVEGPMGQVRAESLTRTINQLPPDRPALLDALATSKEIKQLQAGHTLTIGKQAFNEAIGGYLLGDARKAFDNADWPKARALYQNAWDAGLQSAEVAYGLGQSHLGGFAFAATEREKEQAEEYLLKATRLQPKMADAYKALGDLYSEWERYEEGIAMFHKYLQVSPKARDRSRIERQINKLERKARR